jgi:hypothetical protein
MSLNGLCATPVFVLVAPEISWEDYVSGVIKFSLDGLSPYPNSAGEVWLTQCNLKKSSTAVHRALMTDIVIPDFKISLKDARDDPWRKKNLPVGQTERGVFALDGELEGVEAVREPAILASLAEIGVEEFKHASNCSLSAQLNDLCKCHCGMHHSLKTGTFEFDQRTDKVNKAKATIKALAATIKGISAQTVTCILRLFVNLHPLLPEHMRMRVIRSGVEDGGIWSYAKHEVNTEKILGKTKNYKLFSQSDHQNNLNAIAVLVARKSPFHIIYDKELDEMNIVKTVGQQMCEEKQDANQQLKHRNEMVAIRQRSMILTIENYTELEEARLGQVYV